MRRLSRRCAPLVHADWSASLAEASATLQLHRRVGLRFGPAVNAPLTWGAWRPVILLPAAAAHWPAARRRVILLHELAHIRRWDWLTQTFAYFACAVYWFNPLAWLAARRMRFERERACDDLVLRHGSLPSDYADELLQLATRLGSRGLVNWAAVPMARRSTLEGRLLAILDPRRNRSALTRFVLLATLALAAAIIIPVAMLRADSSNHSIQLILSVVDDPSHPSTSGLPALAVTVRNDSSATFYNYRLIDISGLAAHYEIDGVDYARLGHPSGNGTIGYFGSGQITDFPPSKEIGPIPQSFNLSFLSQLLHREPGRTDFPPVLQPGQHTLRLIADLNTDDKNYVTLYSNSITFQYTPANSTVFAPLPDRVERTVTSGPDTADGAGLDLANGEFVRVSGASDNLKPDLLAQAGVNLFQSPTENNSNALAAVGLTLAPLYGQTWSNITAADLSAALARAPLSPTFPPRPGVRLVPGLYAFSRGGQLGLLEVIGRTTGNESPAGVKVRYQFFANASAPNSVAQTPSAQTAPSPAALATALAASTAGGGPALRLIQVAPATLAAVIGPLPPADSDIAAALRQALVARGLVFSPNAQLLYDGRTRQVVVSDNQQNVDRIVAILHDAEIQAFPDTVETRDYPMSQATLARLIGPNQSDIPAALRNFFINAGVAFPEKDSRLAYDGTRIWVTNTPKNLDRLASLLERYTEIRQVEVTARFLEIKQGTLVPISPRNASATTISQGTIDPVTGLLRPAGDASVDASSNTTVHSNSLTASAFSGVLGVVNGQPVHAIIDPATGQLQLAANTTTGSSSGGNVSAALADPLSAYTAPMIINALEHTSGTDVIAAPRVTVLSGREAQIMVTQNSAKLPGSRFDTDPVGITLSVLPTVNDDHSIDYSIKASLSNLVSLQATSGSVVQNTDVSELVTSGHANNGQMIVFPLGESTRPVVNLDSVPGGNATAATPGTAHFFRYAIIQFNLITPTGQRVPPAGPALPPGTVFQQPTGVQPTSQKRSSPTPAP
jgi:hypothetical protein